MHFLVVEDDEDHAELILHVLAQHAAGHTSHLVTDGEAAWAYMERLKVDRTLPWPDLILLDIKLPKVDGLEVLAHIKRDDVLGSIPVVVLTTSDAEVDRTKAYHAHANSYVVKPINFDRFEALIEELSTYWGKWNHGPK